MRVKARLNPITKQIHLCCRKSTNNKSRAIWVQVENAMPVQLWCTLYQHCDKGLVHGLESSHGTSAIWSLITLTHDWLSGSHQVSMHGVGLTQIVSAGEGSLVGAIACLCVHGSDSIVVCSSDPTSHPNNKILKMICGFICSLSNISN